MPLPEPEPGLVISYSYLWYYERKVPGHDEFHYGFLPPRLFDQVLTAVRAYRTRKKMTMTQR
jgi:hypothetical protein